MKVRAVVEVAGKQEHFATLDRREWRRVADFMRDALALEVERGRCGSVVVAVHFMDERCDHEGP